MNRYWVCKADLQLPWHGRPVNRVAVSPIGESLAAATTVGLYTVDLLDPSSAVAPIAAMLPAAITSLMWNPMNSGLYTGGANGSIRLYRQMFV
jgi:WD40 repeat protein